MIKEKLENLGKKTVDKVKEVIKENLDEKTEDLLYGALAIAAAGFIFGMAGKMIPSRTNLHLYIHVK